MKKRFFLWFWFAGPLCISPLYADSFNDATRAFNEGNFEMAVQQFTSVIDDVNTSPADAARAYSNRGRSYLKLGERRMALQDLNEALRLDPEMISALLSRAILNEEDGELDSALTDYDAVIARNPDSAIAYNRRGNAHYKKTDYDLAVADFNQAVDLDSDNPSHFFNRGLAYHEIGDAESAIQNYDAALRLDPSLPDAWRYRALLYSLSEDFLKATADYDALLRLNPKSALSYQLRGYNRFFAGDYTGATEDFTTMLELVPGSVSAALWLYIAAERAGLSGAGQLSPHVEQLDMSGWPGEILEYLLGRVSESDLLQQSRTTRSIESSERLAQAHFYIGQMHLINNDYDGARENFEATAGTGSIDGFIEYRAAGYELQ